MKQTTLSLLYWIFTILFAGLMIVSALGGIQPTEETVKLVHDGLGYPVYFIRFISIAKLLGAIAILTPRLHRIKEWAYAGLFFDLAGAIYSGIAVNGKPDPKMIFMLLWVIPGVLSYYLWTRKTQYGGEAMLARG